MITLKENVFQMFHQVYPIGKELEKKFATWHPNNLTAKGNHALKNGLSQQENTVISKEIVEIILTISKTSSQEDFQIHKLNPMLGFMEYL